MLIHEGELSDFLLHTRFHLKDNSSAGVLWRATVADQATDDAYLEVPLQRRGGGLAAGSNWSKPAPAVSPLNLFSISTSAARRAQAASLDNWHDLVIQSIGHTVTVLLNGELIRQTTYSKFPQAGRLVLRTPAGSAENVPGEIRFSAIRIRKLQSESTALEFAANDANQLDEHLRTMAVGLPSPLVIGNWSVVDDELKVVSDVGRGQRVEFGDPNWTDYDVQAELKIEKQGELSLIWRAHEGNFWKFDFCAFGGKDNLDLLAAVQGEDRWHHPSRRYMKNALPVEIGRWYHIHVRPRGDTVEVFVDRNRVAESRHEKLPRGRVGAYTYGNSAAGFRKLKVTAPNGEVLWSGLPDI